MKKQVDWNLPYQSHHTGIETYQKQRSVPGNETTNRTTLELKQDIMQFTGRGIPTTNRTTLELKLRCRSGRSTQICSTNRTTLELKLGIEDLLRRRKPATNRTTLELKRVFTHQPQCWTIYQSHHSGIET